MDDKKMNSALHGIELFAGPALNWSPFRFFLVDRTTRVMKPTCHQRWKLVLVPNDRQSMARKIGHQSLAVCTATPLFYGNVFRAIHLDL